MRHHLITRTENALDIATAAAQARTRATAIPATQEGSVDYNYDFATGVAGFIDHVEDLFGPNPTTAFGTGEFLLPDGTRAWNIAYNQGQGDWDGAGDWVANVEWFAEAFPTLLPTLGITVACSSGSFNEVAQTFS